MIFQPGQLVEHKRWGQLGELLVVSVANPPRRVLNKDRVTDTLIPGDDGYFFTKSVTVNVAIPTLTGGWYAKKWDGKGLGESPHDLTPFLNAPIVPMAEEELQTAMTTE